MKKRVSNHDELDLGLLDQEERKIESRIREIADRQRQLTAERDESASMLPPSDLIQDREKLHRHSALVGRHGARNIRHQEKKSIMAFLLLSAAVVSLIWWAVRIIQGG